jgi:hypothetical protein
VVAAQPVDTRAARFMTSFALVVVLATDAVYLSAIRGQNSGQSGLIPDVYTLPFVAGYLVVMAALLVTSLMPLRTPAWRMPLRAAAAGGLLVLGVLAIFSSGLPLVIAGALATGATVRTMRGPFVSASSLSAVAAAVVAVVVLVAGFEVTERMIVCPSQGVMMRSGSGFVTGPYYYACVDGRLSFHSGTCNSATTGIDSSGHATYNGC